MIGDILQPTHLLFILVIALLVLGPKRLPEVGRSLGRGLRDFRSAVSGIDPREELSDISFTTPATPEQPATTDASATPPQVQVQQPVPTDNAPPPDSITAAVSEPPADQATHTDGPADPTPGPADPIPSAVHSPVAQAAESGERIEDATVVEPPDAHAGPATRPNSSE